MNASASDDRPRRIYNPVQRDAATFLETSEEDWQRAVDLNLMSAVRASRLVVPSMRARGRGAPPST